MVVKDASAEALFPHQPQFQPPPRLPLVAAQPASMTGGEQASVANGDAQARRQLPYVLLRKAVRELHARHKSGNLGLLVCLSFASSLRQLDLDLHPGAHSQLAQCMSPARARRHGRHTWRETGTQAPHWKGAWTRTKPWRPAHHWTPRRPGCTGSRAGPRLWTRRKPRCTGRTRHPRPAHHWTRRMLSCTGSLALSLVRTHDFDDWIKPSLPALHVSDEFEYAAALF